MTTSATHEQLAARHAALMTARDEAKGKVDRLRAQIAEADTAAHDALTRTDFDAHGKASTAAAQLKADLPAAEEALAALDRAVNDVAIEKTKVEHRTNRDRLADVVEARGLELAEAFDDAIASTQAAFDKLRLAAQIEAQYVSEQRALHDFRLALGETESRILNVETLIEGVLLEVPLTTQILKNGSADVSSMRRAADFFRTRLQHISAVLTRGRD